MTLSWWCVGIARGGDEAKSDASTSPDKSQYTLFHPVPESDLRDFNPDRPSRFTGPTTLDAGHFQLEADLINYTSDRHQSDRSPISVDQWNVFPPELRVGLTEHTEFDVTYGGYLNLRTRDHAARTDRLQSGGGDLFLQFKDNLLGNEGGNLAFGVLPYLKVPTNTAHLGNGFLEGGVQLPLAVNLPANFSLGLETEFDAVRNAADTRHVAAFTNTAFVGYTFFNKHFQAYGEFFDRVTTGPGAQQIAEVDAGLLYFIGKNAEVDLGCNFGVTRAAPDFEPFVGFSVRY